MPKNCPEIFFVYQRVLQVLWAQSQTNTNAECRNSIANIGKRRWPSGRGCQVVLGVGQATVLVLDILSSGFSRRPTSRGIGVFIHVDPGVAYAHKRSDV